MAIDNRRDILLLLLYAPGIEGRINEPIEGRTRIVKMLFVFRKEVLEKFRSKSDLSEKDFYEFFAWNFGPFSTQVYDDLTFFQLRGFIDSDRGTREHEFLDESAQEWAAWRNATGLGDDDPDNDLLEFTEEAFKLSSKGVSWVEKNLWVALDESQRTMLISFKKKFVSAPLRSILRYVYSEYPEMTAKSTIKDSVLGV